MKNLLRSVAVLVTLLIVLVGALYIERGTAVPLADRSTPAAMSFDRVERVVDLDYPPGNIAVSPEGRIFFTLHPDGRPPRQVVELVDGTPVPYPNEDFQHESETLPFFQSILAIRIDRQNRLWVLDFAEFGRGTPRILAFDLASANLVHEYQFPANVAGLGSMLNDFQVDAEGRYLFIAETSPLLQQPAIVVYDSIEKKSWRRLQSHPSVAAEELLITVGRRPMMLPGGFLPLRIAVDSIALSRDGQWLYYGAVNGSRLYRVPADALTDETVSAEALAAKVENFASKSLSDGLTTDDAGNIYLSDMEHSAVHRMTPDGNLETLISDPLLRWPDGFSFGPDGSLFVTCSALQDVLFRSDESVRAHAPYQIWKFQPGATAAAGH